MTSEDRICSVCKAPEEHFAVHGAIDHEGMQQFESSLEVEMKFVDTDVLTQRESMKGWRYNMFNGRHSQWRLVCVPCLIATGEANELWEDMRKEALKLEEAQSPKSFMATLCNE